MAARANIYSDLFIIRTNFGAEKAGKRINYYEQLDLCKFNRISNRLRALQTNFVAKNISRRLFTGGAFNQTRYIS